MADTKKEIKASNITFSPEQLDLVQKMIEASKSTSNNDRTSISRYTNIRDPKSIEQVNVSRFDGMFVVGFKDLNNDAYRKVPKYSENKLDISRKLPDQPFVTLLLSNDGEKIVEKEVSLINYMDFREKIPCKVVKINKKEIIDDKGLLGQGGSGGFAGEVDKDNKIIQNVAVKAEVLREEITVLVEVPGFVEPYLFKEVFLA